MVEKWLGRPIRPMRAPPMKRVFRGNRAHYGKPAQLFKDSDRDGVPNVFDCKPYNKRRQDVISPFSGSNPVNDMWGRQENARLIREQQRRLDELRKLEEEKLKEMQRLSNVTVIDKTKYNTSYVGVSGKSGQTKVFTNKNDAEDYSVGEPKITVTTEGPKYVSPKTPSNPPSNNSGGGTTKPKPTLGNTIGNFFKNTILKSPVLIFKPKVK